MSFLRALKHEIKSILHHRGSKVLLFIGPWFLTLYFGGVYYNDYVKDIPIAVLDEDNSSTSNLLINYFLTNERFDIKYYPTSDEELKSLIEDSKVYMGLYIPRNFGNDVAAFRASQVLAIVDGTNSVIANNAYANATTIVQSMGAGVEMKLIQGKGLSPDIAGNLALAFNFQERVLYDPKMTYMNTLMLCFLAVFIQQLLLSSIGSLILRDNEYISEGKTAVKVLAAVSACFICILPTAGISLMLLFTFFHMHIIIRSIPTALLLTAVFALSIAVPALFISSFTRDRLKYSQISFMLSLPTFVSSGSIWPADQIPPIVKYIIKAFWPLINYDKPFQEILLKGMPLSAVTSNILQIILYTAIWVPLALYCYKRAFKGKEIKILS